MDKTEHNDAENFWDEFYNKKEKAWSGNVNPQLARVAGTLEPGTVLDLGCGEGGDTVWLAERGWQVTATDISEVALLRTKQLAENRQVADKVTTEQHDLEKSFPAGKYDLISAQFLQSPLEFRRQRVLQQAAAAVALNGVLLIVEHGGAPSFGEHSSHVFPTTQESFNSLELNESEWDVLEVAALKRNIANPSGGVATIVDNVIVVKRVATS